jgi:hypothetical protein
MLRPSGFTAAFRPIATFWAVAMAAWRSDSAVSKMVGVWFLTMTRQWPAFSGLMSMIAIVRSSS